MFSFRQSRFGGGEDPWFRLGTFDVGSAGIVSLAVVASMLVWAAEGPGHAISSELVYSSPGVTSGEIWRMITWFFPNNVSIWNVISAVFVYLFGSQLEGALGRIGMAKYLAVVAAIPPVLALVIYSLGYVTRIEGLPVGAALLSSALFYTFICHLPTAQFFFGIPGWVIGAVFFGVEFLNAVADRNLGALLFVVGRVGLVLLAAKAFGLADDVSWIPDLRTVSGGGGAGQSAARSRGGRVRRSKGPDLTVVADDSFDSMGIDAILDQVSAHGVDSLTSEQKKRLKAYSKQQRKRKG